MFTNIRVEFTDNQTWVVRADSKRFGKDAIIFEHWDKSKAEEYAATISSAEAKKLEEKYS